MTPSILKLMNRLLVVVILPYLTQLSVEQNENRIKRWLNLMIYLLILSKLSKTKLSAEELLKEKFSYLEN